MPAVHGPKRAHSGRIISHESIGFGPMMPASMPRPGGSSGEHAMVSSQAMTIRRTCGTSLEYGVRTSATRIPPRPRVRTSALGPTSVAPADGERAATRPSAAGSRRARARGRRRGRVDACRSRGSPRSCGKEAPSRTQRAPAHTPRPERGFARVSSPPEHSCARAGAQGRSATGGAVRREPTRVRAPHQRTALAHRGHAVEGGPRWQR